MALQHITTNLSKVVRHDTLEGVDHLVVPMVMLTEGVHNGNNGPLLYPKEELSKYPLTWNHKPVVVYHPEINGMGVSACSPDMLNSRKIGVVLNTKFDGKLRSEAWIRSDRTKEIDDRVLTAIENNQMMEVSTGLFTENEEVEGEWNGEKYVAIARNYQPDHLAVLPDKIGACSIADGAGLLQLNEAMKDPARLKTLMGAAYERALRSMGLTDNEMSHANIRSALWRFMRDTFNNDDSWIEDVYPGFFVYSSDSKLFRLGYSVSGNQITVVGEPEEVVQVTEYRTPSGTFVGNSESREKDMPKTKLSDGVQKAIDGLITNKASKFEEADREWLSTLNEDQLGKLEPAPAVEDKIGAGSDPAAVQAAADKGAAGLKPEGQEPQLNTTEPKKELSAEEYIAAAPVGVREVLTNGLASLKTEKAKHIATITANKRNTFSKESLEAKSIEDLRSLASLAAEPSPPQHQQGPAFNYGNAIHGGMVDNAEGDGDGEEPLVAPTMNFEAAAK